MDSQQGVDPSDVAVIGMAGRFPGANNLDQFWELLKQGREGLAHFERDELVTAGEDPELLKQATYVSARGILENIDEFDAAYFDLSPMEAEYTDPQQRIFLEECAAALQVSGYDPLQFKGLIGVYGGVASSTYWQAFVLPNIDCSSPSQYMQALAGNDKDFLATRVSYKLHLNGPSYTVQTACSTSLAAIHMACQSLISGECDMALAGGVTIRIPQTRGYLYEQGALVSADGHVRAFDAEATGTVPGNGVGVVVLKPLKNALADGDTIYAVVKGSAANNDGGSKASYAAPGKAGQAAVVREALAVSRVAAETITYVEAQGSATKLGDPVEVAALTEAFRKQTSKRSFCALGSVKSNVGALDAAGGVAGFIKTVLMLRHRALVPSINYTQPNRLIDFASSPFYVNTELRSWNSEPDPRRAGVSSFGMGGTNVHVILEEAPAELPSEPAKSHQILLLSARSSSVLEQMRQDLLRYFHCIQDVALADVAHTLAVGRSHRRHRLAVTCRDIPEAIEALESKANIGRATNHVGIDEARIVFEFPADVTHVEQLTTELRAAEPEFLKHFETCVRLGLPTRGRRGAVFAYEFALGRLWLHCGLVPVAVRGHGVGELVAACLSQTMTLERAVEFIEAPSAASALLPSQGRFPIEQPCGSGAGGSEPIVLVAGSEPAIEALRRAWLAGARIDWVKYYSGHRRRRVPLPHYPFERRRYWMKARSVVSENDVRVRDGGVYIILGGSERLALVFAECIARTVKAHLALAGETRMSAAGRSRLAAIRASGTSAIFAYVRSGSEGKSDLRDLVDLLRSEHGVIDGIIDASAIRESFLEGRSDQELAAKAREFMCALWSTRADDLCRPSSTLDSHEHFSELVHTRNHGPRESASPE